MYANSFSYFCEVICWIKLLCLLLRKICVNDITLQAMNCCDILYRNVFMVYYRGSLFTVHCLHWMNEWINEWNFLYGASKTSPQKLNVHSARSKQCIKKVDCLIYFPILMFEHSCDISDFLKQELEYEIELVGMHLNRLMHSCITCSVEMFKCFT